MSYRQVKSSYKRLYLMKLPVSYYFGHKCPVHSLFLQLIFYNCIKLMASQLWGTQNRALPSNYNRGSSYGNRLPSINKPAYGHSSNIPSNNYMLKSVQSHIGTNQYQYSTQSTTKPKGLQNLTNTCYMSSALQVLLRIIPDTMDSGSVTKAFFKLRDTHNRKDYQAFKRAAEKQIWFVKGWGQQDAQEFLISFLEVLNKENSKSIVKSGTINLDYNQKQGVTNNWRVFVSNMQKIENSQIINLFYGQSLRQFECPKGHLKHKFERYLHLSLYFPQTKSTGYSAYHGGQNSVKVQTLIQKQLGTETIDGLLCQTCNQKCKFKKKTFLYTLPKYLILHFARFKRNYYKQEKINTQIQFDEQIELKEQQSSQNIKYKLNGIVNHFGTLNGGHYFADVKVNHEWYQCNDDRVSPAKIQSQGNLSKYAYILVYERQ